MYVNNDDILNDLLDNLKVCSLHCHWLHLCLFSIGSSVQFHFSEKVDQVKLVLGAGRLWWPR